MKFSDFLTEAKARTQLQIEYGGSGAITLQTKNWAYNFYGGDHEKMAAEALFEIMVNGVDPDEEGWDNDRSARFKINQGELEYWSGKSLSNSDLEEIASKGVSERLMVKHYKKLLRK